MNSNNIFVQWILFATIIRIRLFTIVILKIQRNPRLSTFNYPKRGAIVSLILVKFFLNKDVSKFASNDIRPSSILSPWWTRSVSVVRTHIHGSKEEGCRWDWYLDARNRWISGSRTIPGVLQCSGTLKTSRDNGAEWATAAWHAALPRASLSLSLSIHPSVFLSSSVGARRDKVKEEFIVGRAKFWWKIFPNVYTRWEFLIRLFQSICDVYLFIIVLHWMIFSIISLYY